MSAPAFIAHPLPALRTRVARRNATCRRRAPCAVASADEAARAQSRTHVRAPVVDSRVAGVSEAHHWICVRSDYARAFERAAAANASVTAVVEERAGRGASRRWVLRRVADPSLGFIDGSFVTDTTTFVVMEAFRDGEHADDAHTHRWLSAVRRTSRALGALDIQSMPYYSIFSARRHHARPETESAVIVVESINVDMSRPENLEDIKSILRSGAEASVNAGESLDFSVLQAKGEPSFFKTVEVYENVDAMRTHMERLDRAFVRRSRGKLIGHHRERQTFKAILFA